MMPIDTGLLQFIIVASVLFAIPAGIVLKRLGFSMWWAALCLIPAAALVGLWVLAFIGWNKPATE